MHMIRYSPDFVKYFAVRGMPAAVENLPPRHYNRVDKGFRQAEKEYAK